MKTCDECGDYVFEKISEHTEGILKFTIIKCLNGHQETITQVIK